MARILLIEDDPDIADNAIVFLEHKEHDVVHVSKGMDGLEQMRFGEFDLVILDGNLPDMDGLDVCKSYREEGGILPIIMASGRASQQEKRQAASAGANAYIVKPYSLKDLQDEIESLISSKN